MENEDVFASLVTWVRKHDGYVHQYICAKYECSTANQHENGSNHPLTSTKFVNRTLYASKDASDDGDQSINEKTNKANALIISKGELLIRLPSCLILSGESLPDKLDLPSKEQRYISPWLRCLTMLIMKMNESDKQCSTSTGNSGEINEKDGAEAFETKTIANVSNICFGPYIRSLPMSFDTLLSWSDDELKFLKGTTLGSQIQHEKDSNALETKFQSNCKPVIEHLSSGLVLPSSKTNQAQNQKTDYETSKEDSKKGELNNPCVTFEQFVWATQAISTRGFHMQSVESASSTSAAQPSDDGKKSPQLSTREGMGGIGLSDQNQDDRASNYVNVDDTTVLEEKIKENETHKNISLTNTTSSFYNGPFLLPVIDMLNHEPCPTKRCTTLRRDPQDGSFYMIAERDIFSNEEILHSYGNDLTSAQLLQTFGFVHHDSSQRMASWSLSSSSMVNKMNYESLPSEQLNASSQGIKATGANLSPTDPLAANETDRTRIDLPITPATLSRHLLVQACWEEASRRGRHIDAGNENFSTAVQSSRKRRRDSTGLDQEEKLCATRKSMVDDEEEEEDDEEEEVWDPRECWEEKKHFLMSNNELIPDEIIVEYNNPFNEYLITCCAIMLLPQEAFEDFVSSPSLLDESVLDDTYLGMMICNALQESIQRKLLLYYGASSTFKSDQEMLRRHLEQTWTIKNSSASCPGTTNEEPQQKQGTTNIGSTISRIHQIYALTVKLEERVSLQSLTEHILEVQADLMTPVEENTEED